ncbi:MAG: flagellar protein FliS [Myxococcota bacterium]|jgi:flagellar biosynthetic protein FliS|nr:flagellar protein FliS [Myxococcota bacterium]
MDQSTQASPSTSSSGMPILDRGQLLMRYYDSVLIHLDTAIQHMSSENTPMAQEPLYLAASLLAEMIRALDYQMAPDLCSNLETLYMDVVDKLVLAFDTSSVAPIEQAREVMTQLRNAWRQII